MELTEYERDILRTVSPYAFESLAIRRRLRDIGLRYCRYGDHVEPDDRAHFSVNTSTCRQCTAELSKSYYHERGGKERAKTVRKATKRAYMSLKPMADEQHIPLLSEDFEGA